MMNYWTTDVGMPRREPFMSAEPAAIGIWWRVMSYCVEHENGGIIRGSATWNDRAWTMAAGVTAAEIRSAAPLIIIEGHDVIAAEFPQSDLDRLQQKRTNGKKGGRPPAGNHPKTSGFPPDNHPPDKVSSPESYREGKGREEREGERDAPGREAPSPAEPSAVNYPASEDEVFAFSSSVGMPWTLPHARYWLLHMLECGWTVTGAHGTRAVHDWRAACRKASPWVIDAVARLANSGSSAPGQKKNWDAPPDAPPLDPAQRPGRPEPTGDWRAAFRTLYAVEPTTWRAQNDDIQREVLAALRRRAA